MARVAIRAGVSPFLGARASVRGADAFRNQAFTKLAALLLGVGHGGGAALAAINLAEPRLHGLTFGLGLGVSRRRLSSLAV